MKLSDENRQLINDLMDTAGAADMEHLVEDLISMAHAEGVLYGWKRGRSDGWSDGYGDARLKMAAGVL